MSRQLTAASSLEGLKKEAKRWLKAIREHDPQAVERFHHTYSSAPSNPVLRDVQHALALEHGLSGWKELIGSVAASPASLTLRQYEEKAEALLDAYHTGTLEAMRRHWKHTWHRRNWEAMRTYVQLDLGKRADTPGGDVDITLDDARYLVALEHGFDSWQALGEFFQTLADKTTALAEKPVRIYTRDVKGDEQTTTQSREWDVVLGMMAEQRIPCVAANGQMSDAMLERISRMEHVTTLELEGSLQLTDAGMRHLANMPQLERLDLSLTNVTDKGLGVLRHLPVLKHLKMCWQQHVTDKSLANLAHCQQIENVNLMGTMTGNGVVRALAGKEGLTHLITGRLVDDKGIPHLGDLPVFKTWRGGEVGLSLMSTDAAPNHLTLDGPFTDRGLAQLAGLDGLFGLSFFWHSPSFTAEGLRMLKTLPHLGMLGVEGEKCTDEAMRYIGEMPHLQMLMAQDTVAGDDGFVALSRSQTIEKIWGRRCHNLRSRGFRALATMPSMRSLSVSCLNVEDEALAAFPSFPALRELMPMDVPDAGYRHIGKCDQLETLTLMYCRETTDEATTHITGLPHLKKYFASYTLITDRTPQLLSSIESLEEITLSSCAGLTNEGIVHLARLPKLRELDLGGMQHVTEDVGKMFSPAVRVKYSG